LGFIFFCNDTNQDKFMENLPEMGANQALTSDFDFLMLQTEALLFCATSPIKPEEISSCLSELLQTEVNLQTVEVLLAMLIGKYATGNFAFQLVKTGGGYQFLTKNAYQEVIQTYLRQKSKKKLSRAALETIAIIAYEQPITKSKIEHIRGVNSDYAIQKLLEKELIVIQGKAESIGRPVLYATSPRFIDYLGINSLAELPSPKDLQTENSNEIGTENSIYTGN
jgi:segregation and condensation protein B